MTAQCDPYMGALKILETPWLRPRLLFLKFFHRLLLWLMNVRTKFKVRSFTRSWDNRGHPKTFANLGSLWLCAHSIPQKSYMPSCQPYILFIYVHSFSHDFRLQFWVGVANPQFGEGKAVWGQGWYRSKERWWVPIGRPLHTNFSSIFTRFRDIATFAL